MGCNLTRHPTRESRTTGPTGRSSTTSPINEPWVVSWLGYGTGHHAPGIADRSQAVAAAHHTVAAHNLAIRALKAAAPGAQVGPVLNQSLPSVDDITDPFQKDAAAQ